MTLVAWCITGLIVAILFGMAFEKEDFDEDEHEPEDTDTSDQDDDRDGGRSERDDELDDPRHGQARFINR